MNATTNNTLRNVISVRNYTVHVSSDHAWVDSGNRTEYLYWDETTETLRTHTTGGCAGSQYPETIEASEEIRSVATNYVNAVNWMFGRSTKLSEGGGESSQEYITPVLRTF